MDQPLKILFVVRSTTFFLRYRSIIRALLRRGHNVGVLFERWEERWTKGSYLRPIKDFLKEEPNFRYGWALKRQDRWHGFLSSVRVILSYRRYLKVKTQSSYFRDRYINFLPKFLKISVLVPGFNIIVKSALKSRWCGNFLRRLENSIPPGQKIVNQLKNLKPDVLVDTYGDLSMMSSDLEYLKAAVALKIPSAVPVMSWDTLTTKGIMHILPDALLVWNEVQRDEAKKHHEFSNERIKITGAPYFDDWFENRKPPTDRIEFCSRYGLNPDKPIILYFGSSAATTAKSRLKETTLIENLKKNLNGSSDAKIRDVQFIVRPHPMNYTMYENWRLKETVIVPPEGALPDTQESFDLLYNSIYHSLAVVGVYTSAMIAAIIVGKPVFLMMLDDYHLTQASVEHVKSILGGGAIEPVKSQEEFVVRLCKVLENQGVHRSKQEAFIKNFIRPKGLNFAAGEINAQEIEKLGIRKKHG